MAQCPAPAASSGRSNGKFGFQHSFVLLPDVTKPQADDAIHLLASSGVELFH
jgi:hypothetical protein